MKIGLKIFLTVISMIAAVFGGFIVLFMVAFAGAATFYQILVPICVITILLFIFSQIWGWSKPRNRILALSAVLGIVLLCTAGFEINKAYHNSFEKINEQGVDLTQYAPFADGTKAVSLDTPASLILESDLPKLDGATALYPLYAAFARATYPEQDYKVNIYKENDYVICTNTVGSYERLISGEADIIFAAAPSKEQLQYAKDKGIELKLTPIGREAFVFFVNAKNQIDNLSTKDIQRIYSGEATNWSEFGGKNSSIRAFQRPDNSGSQTMLQKIMDDKPLMTPPKEDVAAGMGGIISQVSSYRNYDNAIGYSFLFFATEMVKDNKIKLISVNGIAPTKESVANKTYPYAAEFYAVTAGTENENTQKLIDWILSEQGQSLVEKTGYTPIY